MWRGGTNPGACVAQRRVSLEARAPGAAVVPLKELSADVGTRVGVTRGKSAAGLNPERWPARGTKVDATGKIFDARRFLAAVGSERA